MVHCNTSPIFDKSVSRISRMVVIIGVDLTVAISCEVTGYFHHLTLKPYTFLAHSLCFYVDTMHQSLDNLH